MLVAFWAGKLVRLRRSVETHAQHERQVELQLIESSTFRSKVVRLRYDVLR